MKKIYFLFFIALNCSVYAQDEINIDGNPCPMVGSAKAAREKAQNPFKNRYNLPQIFEDKITLNNMIQGDLGDISSSQGKAVKIKGYVYDVKYGGKPETCNCGTLSPDFLDTHIEITPDKNHTEAKDRIVVEVTPRIRNKMKDKGEDWSTPALQNLIGRMVEIDGWLFYDYSHEDAAFSTDPDDSKGHKNWRASPWEVHPITAIIPLDDLPIVFVESDEKTLIPISEPIMPNTINSTLKITSPMNTTSAPIDIFITLLLGAFLGMIGQGLRVWVGISKANADPVNKDKDMKDYIETRRIVFSFLYAFIIGSLTGGLMAVDHIGGNWDKSLIISIITAGYAGTDFIEGFIHKNFK